MNDYNIPVDEETFASWLDGTLTEEENTSFMDMCAKDPAMQEILDANDDIEESYDIFIENGYELPDELLYDFNIPGGDNDYIYNSEEQVPSDQDYVQNDLHHETTSNNHYIDYISEGQSFDDEESNEEYFPSEEDSDNDYF